MLREQSSMFPKSHVVPAGKHKEANPVISGITCVTWGHLWMPWFSGHLREREGTNLNGCDRTQQGPLLPQTTMQIDARKESGFFCCFWVKLVFGFPRGTEGPSLLTEEKGMRRGSQ